MLLPFPPNDEISIIGEAVFQRIQWRRHDIVLRSKQFSSQTVAKGNKRSASDAAQTIVPSKEADEPAGASKTALITAATNNAPKTDTAKTEAKNVASKSVPNTAATKGAAENAATIDKKEAAKSAPNTAAAKSAAVNAASGEKKVAANTRAEKKKMTENKKQPKQKGITPAQTKANPYYKYGQPMLTAAQLESTGPATNALHK